MKKILLACSFAMCLFGCNTRPIVSVQSEAVPTFAVESAQNLSAVEQAISAGARKAGWTTQVLKPGLIEASVTARSHKAIVDIAFTEKTYSINYKDSDNMKVSGDEIHKKYNQWVLRLSQFIRTELNEAAKKK